MTPGVQVTLIICVTLIAISIIGRKKGCQKMIKTKKGKTRIEGTLLEIKTDLTIIIKEVRKCLSRDFTEERIDEIIATSVELSKKGETEVHDMAVAALMELIGGVL